MPELISEGFKTLFEIRLLHHYWLDDAATLFDQLTTDEQAKRLLNYDIRSFFQIRPTDSTLSILAATQCLFRETSLGCIVLAAGTLPIPDDTQFEFVLTVLHPDFHQYTIHSLYSKPITAIFYEPELAVYRFKENVFVFENMTGTKRGSTLYLSKEIPNMTQPATSYAIESLVQSGGTLTMITNQKGGTRILYPPAAPGSLPVFIHQEDIPAITPPAGMVGAPAKGLTLSDEIPDDVYALFRVHMVHPVDTDFSCTTAGFPKTTAPVFQVRFKNRITNWQYKSKTSPDLSTGDLGELPMTFFGNASPGPNQRTKPSTQSIQLQFDGVGPAKKIEKIISEIFE